MRTEDIIRYNKAAEQQIKVGDWVYIHGLNRNALVTEVSDTIVWVSYGDIANLCLYKTEVTRLPE